ncbi:MAG: hypothetical protein H5T86_12385, partial [Armatimonadetes bacterium]|nr:hypothetical protein [Armatimonadota bacterium]
GGAADGTIWVAAYKLSEMSHPWEEPAQCWIGCWPGWGHLLVDALEVEYSDGSRAHEPSMDTLALEYSADTRPQVPVLDVVELEYSDGSGSHTPVMDRLAIEYSDGTGGGQPILDLVGVEYAAEAWGSEPALDEAAVEYAMSRPAPPGQGEAALVLEPISSDEPIVAVRVVLAELSEAERGQCRCLVRADSEDLAVDNWESYEEFEPERNYYLEHPGRTVRVAVIGPASAPAPDVFVQTEV